MAGRFRLKRVYEEPSKQDGVRILTDRLWPRGMKKQDARLDEWDKALAPSTELRRWFHADRENRAAEFAERYRAELSGEEQQERLAALRERAATSTVTLLTGTADAQHSYLAVLLAELEQS
ncbi:DUF488 family protein [Actinospica durhamensis]|uniref:DUF488 family protein n=1 Tax=Actinospica durhamensis TaxID=1508375 RepID=A0A941ESC9_9ACTN|nr:DUF488 family protein [Actinospica durhamensis]MBR7836635.1 DUF488 family protein [Actinospica durhamensis]